MGAVVLHLFGWFVFKSPIIAFIRLYGMNSPNSQNLLSGYIDLVQNGFLRVRMYILFCNVYHFFIFELKWSETSSARWFIP